MAESTAPADAVPADANCRAAGEGHHHGYVPEAAAINNRLRRVEGQVRGLQRMVDDEAYCIDIITQISAAKAALDRVATLLLKDHLNHCVADAARSGNTEEMTAKVAEATDAVTRLLKS